MDSLLPFLQGTHTPYNMPVYPGALRVDGDSGVRKGTPYNLRMPDVTNPFKEPLNRALSQQERDLIRWLIEHSFIKDSDRPAHAIRASLLASATPTML